MSAALQTAEAARRFTLAGNARVTISSARTGARYTYRFRRIEDAPMRFFVSLLTGPDNGSDYQYLGLLDAEAETPLRLAGKTRFGITSTPFIAARFFCEKVVRDGVMPEELEVRHEGRCGRCGRALTTPESIDRGIGPECWERMGS